MTTEQPRRNRSHQVTRLERVGRPSAMSVASRSAPPRPRARPQGRGRAARAEMAPPATAAAPLSPLPPLPPLPPHLNKYSARITQPKSQGASQAMLYATGLREEDMAKPQARTNNLRPALGRPLLRVACAGAESARASARRAAAAAAAAAAAVVGPARSAPAPRRPAGGHQQRVVRGQQLQHAPQRPGALREGGRAGGWPGACATRPLSRLSLSLSTSLPYTPAGLR